MHKYFLPFLLALTLHLAVIGVFVINTSSSETKVDKTEKAPEIIAATILDETLVTAKAQELRQQQENKQRTQQKQRDDLDRQLKQEEKRLLQTKNSRIQEEKLARKKADQLKKSTREEQKKLQEITQAVALAKKTQQLQEQERLAAEKKRALEKN